MKCSTGYFAEYNGRVFRNIESKQTGLTRLLLAPVATRGCYRHRRGYYCHANGIWRRIDESTIFEQRFEEYAAVVDFGVAEVDILRLFHMIRFHVAEVDPSERPVALVQRDGQDAELQVNREPVGDAYEPLALFDGQLVVHVAQGLELFGLQHVPHAHVLVGVLGNYVAFVVEYMVLFDARFALYLENGMSI